MASASIPVFSLCLGLPWRWTAACKLKETLSSPTCFWPEWFIGAAEKQTGDRNWLENAALMDATVFGGQDYENTRNVWLEKPLSA